MKDILAYELLKKLDEKTDKLVDDLNNVKVNFSEFKGLIILQTKENTLGVQENKQAIKEIKGFVFKITAGLTTAITTAITSLIYFIKPSIIR